MINLDNINLDVICWPDEIIVIGGGRWARVIIDQLQDFRSRQLSVEVLKPSAMAIVLVLAPAPVVTGTFRGR